MGDAYGNIASVAVDVFPSPHAASDVAHAFFDDFDFRAVEESFYFFPSDRIVLFPRENLIGKRGGYGPIFRHNLGGISENRYFDRMAR